MKAGEIAEVMDPVMGMVGATATGKNIAQRFFQKPALDRAFDQSHLSRETVVELTPGNFLALARAARDDPEKISRVKGILNRKEQFNDVPFLKVEMQKDGSARVIGHEGRNRARQLGQLGVEKIPVRIISVEGGPAPAIRWGNDPRRPLFLRPQEGAINPNSQVPFPEVLTVPTPK